ncbi:MAG: radical SAM protein [Deltaproteobacteria bacterium]|nr:radical SAM protein [Deltaproteobacteria bacterium]
MTPTLKELCLEVTNLCPMACIHCSTNSVQLGAGSSESIPIDVAKRVVKDLKTLGGKILEISGGEPLLYPQLFELIHYAADINLEVRLYTCGIISTKESGIEGINSELINKLITAGISRIIFNLQGSLPQTHEKIAGVKGAHALVLDGIRNAKATGVWTGVHFVPMAPNFREIDNLMTLCWSLGVDELALLRFVPQGRGLVNRALLDLTLEQFNDFLKLVALKKEIYPGLEIRAGCPMDFLSLYEKELEPHPCKAGRCTCSVAPSGDVIPCPGFKDSPDFIAGNIYRENLKVIWREGFKILRDFDYHSIDGACRECPDLEWCHGRCGAQRVIAYGDLFMGPDPRCPKLLKNVNQKKDKKLDRLGELTRPQAIQRPNVEPDNQPLLIAYH